MLFNLESRSHLPVGVHQDGSNHSLCFFSEFHQAKEMVAIADKVASKLEEKKGSITEDEVNNYGHNECIISLRQPIKPE